MTDPDIKAVRNKSFAAGAVFGVVATALIGLAINQTVGANQMMPAATAAPMSAQAESMTTPAASASAKEQGAKTGTQVDLARRDANDFMAIGDVDAPVVIVEFADYRCPFCSLFEQSILPEIKENYIDKGLVRLEFNDMPVFGEQSVSAAVAGRAAGNQGKFWEFLHLVAANGVAEGGHPNLSQDRLIEFATEAGVPDIEKFKAEMTDETATAQVREDYLLGQQLGTSGVPMFWIGDTPMAGAQPFANFAKVIDAELEQAGVK